MSTPLSKLILIQISLETTDFPRLKFIDLLLCVKRNWLSLQMLQSLATRHDSQAYCQSDNWNSSSKAYKSGLLKIYLLYFTSGKVGYHFDDLWRYFTYVKWLVNHQTICIWQISKGICFIIRYSWIIIKFWWWVGFVWESYRIVNG